jgi:hypothetical protein
MLAGLAVVVAVMGGPAPSWAEREPIDGGKEASLAFLAAGANLFYVPAKLVVAGLGLAAGGVAGVLTGGSERAAYAFWVPTATGTFMLGPAEIWGDKPVEFFGHDYADRPSTAPAAAEAGSIYEAAYSTR